MAKIVGVWTSPGRKTGRSDGHERRQAIAAERLSLGGGGADRDQPLRVGTRASRGRGDETHRVVEATRLREAGVAELTP